MKKGLAAALAAGSLSVLLSTASAGGRECDYLSPCTPENNSQNNTQQQHQSQNQNAVGVGVGNGYGGNAANRNDINVDAQGGRASNSNVIGSRNENDVRNDIRNVAASDVSAVTGNNTTGNNTIDNSYSTKYINPATPGVINGQVNGSCMQTEGVSIGMYLGSFATQTGNINMDCVVWNTAMVLLDKGINLNDPTYQAIALEAFREMDIRIDNAVISVMAASQQRFMNGLAPATSPFALIDMNGKHGQNAVQPKISPAFD